MPEVSQVIIYERWKQNVFESLKSLADYESQKIIWLGQSKEFADSFDESVAMLFDSLTVEDFISDEYWSFINLPETIHKPLKKLIDSLSTYADLIYQSSTQPTDAEILIDPAWIAITYQAERVVQLWQ